MRRPVNFVADAVPSVAGTTPSASPSSVTVGTAMAGSAASRRCRSAYCLIAVGETEAVPIAVDHDIDIVGLSNASAVRSKVASSKCQFGDPCRHNILAISRRLAASPARPRSS